MCLDKCMHSDSITHYTRGVVRQVAASTLGRSEPGQNERVAADAFGCVPLAATWVWRRTAGSVIFRQACGE
eukprot:SAG25_NODE_1824_length_2289_cov_6.831507_3_plen_71_part_00